MGFPPRLLRYRPSLVVISAALILCGQAAWSANVDVSPAIGDIATAGGGFADSTSIMPTTPTTTTTTTRAPNMMDRARRLIAEAMRSAEGSPLVRRLMRTELSPECTIGLLRFMRDIRNLEPWAVRLIDASGKYPTGLFQGTISDIGAYDECVETVVHDQFGHVQVSGQYCNMYIKLVNDTSLFDHMLPAFLMTNKRTTELFQLLDDDRVRGLRVGICTMSDCSKKDIQAIASTLGEGIAKITVNDCVTGESVSITPFQIAIIAMAGVNVLLLIFSTSFDMYARKKNMKRTIVVKLLSAFSVPRNTNTLLYVSRNTHSEAYCYRFLHGLRFFSLFWIVLGHTSMAFDPVISRFANVLEATGSWFFCTFSTAFLSVDTFFFLSGFLLAYNVLKVDLDAWIIIAVALTRRLIRVMVPVGYVILAFFLVPLLFSGPNSKLLFDSYYEESNQRWWQLLLQVRNFYNSTDMECFAHLWYLSTDFQLFLICILVLAVLRKRQSWMMWTFLGLSLFCSAFSAWQMQTGRYLPVIPSVVADLTTMADTFNDVYMMATFHGASYFLGCVTVLILQKYKKAEMSRATEVVLWCASIACALTCILARRHWNAGIVNPGAWEDVAFAFFDRLLWSGFLSWLVIACARGRGGFVCTFLSWGAFVPLSRLSFGVYLVHLPYFVVMCFVSRERIYYSMLGVISTTFSIFVWSCLMSYCLFILCECPTGVIEKTFLAFNGIEKTVHGHHHPKRGGAAGIKDWAAANGKKTHHIIPTVVVGQEPSSPATDAGTAPQEITPQSCRL